MVNQGHRKNRLAGTIKKHLGSELARDVKDPRLATLYIEDVTLTGDLGLVKVNVRLVVGGDDPKARAEAMAALKRIAPGLRASLGPVLQMRRLPDLRFFYDEGADHRAKIDAVLEEIQREAAQRQQSDAASIAEVSPEPPAEHD